MHKLLAFSFLFFSLTAGAQHRRASPRHQKDIQHTVGIQLNELIRSVFNFTGNYPFNQPSAFPTNNPYLLTYSLNARETGWGVRAGAGYLYSKFPQNYLYDRTTQTTTQIRVRLGMEKAFWLSRRWSTGVGVDAVWNHDRDEYDRTSWINSTPPAVPDTTFDKRLAKSYTLGGGPSVWLRYHITSRIQLGTEANLYYYGGEERTTNEYRIVRAAGNSPAPRYASFEDDIRLARFTLPVALFLSVRF